MANQKKRPGYAMRYESPEVEEELNYLVSVLGMSKNKVLNLLIRQEYNSYMKDPVIQEYLTKMKAIRDILSDGAEGQTRLF